MADSGIKVEAIELDDAQNLYLSSYHSTRFLEDFSPAVGLMLVSAI